MNRLFRIVGWICSIYVDRDKIASLTPMRSEEIRERHLAIPGCFNFNFELRSKYPEFKRNGLH